MSDFVSLPQAFPEDSENVLEEAVRLGPLDGPRFILNNLPFGGQIAVAVMNGLDVDVRSAQLALCHQIYDILVAHQGRLRRVAAPTRSQQSQRLDYSNLSPAEAAKMKAEPKNAKPGSLASFCLHNQISLFFCISTADLAVVVRRAQLKQQNLERREAEEREGQEAKRAKGLLARIFQWLRGGAREEH